MKDEIKDVIEDEYSLVDKNDPILKETMPHFDFENPPIDPKELAMILYNNLKKSNGIGLSAPQIGLRYRVFIMRGEPNIVCFNPKIVDTSSYLITLEEGCLSFPYFYVKVKRPRIIKVRFSMPNGDTTTKKFDGITARIFQHELNHLDGIVMHERASNLHLSNARRKYKLLLRKVKKSKRMKGAIVDA